MELEIDIERREGYLHVAARGPWDLGLAQAHMERVSRASAESGVHRVLVDFRSMDAPAQQMDRFHAGIHVSTVWKPPMRVAGVWQPENINRFAEDTAVNRGAVFRMFPDEEQALAWLLDDVGSGALS